jgi:hypothetical protein
MRHAQRAVAKEAPALLRAIDGEAAEHRNRNGIRHIAAKAANATGSHSSIAAGIRHLPRLEPGAGPRGDGSRMGETTMADEKTMPKDDKMSSEDAVPQADKQAHTDIAQREGQQGEQAAAINKKEPEKKSG